MDERNYEWFYTRYQSEEERYQEMIRYLNEYCNQYYTGKTENVSLAIIIDLKNRLNLWAETYSGSESSQI